MSQTPREERLSRAAEKVIAQWWAKSPTIYSSNDDGGNALRELREALRESAPPAAPASEPPIICCEPFDALGKNFCRLPAGHGGAHSPRKPQPVAVAGPSELPCWKRS